MGTITDPLVYAEARERPLGVDEEQSRYFMCNTKSLWAQRARFWMVC